MALLEVRDLVTGFGSNQVLNGIDLDVEAGKVSVLLGLNGAGKSVTMKTISGLQPAWSGSIRLEGQEISRLEAEDRIRGGLGHVLQSKAVFAHLTVLQNLRLGAACLKDRSEADANRERVFAIYPRLRERSGQLAGSLSGGEQAMLAVARSLMGSPKLLLIDEPSAGLSPVMVEALGETLRQVAAGGTTLLMVEQNVGFALELADEVHVLEKGRVVYEDRASALDMARVSELLGIGDLLSPPKPRRRPAAGNGAANGKASARTRKAAPKAAPPADPDNKPAKRVAAKTTGPAKKAGAASRTTAAKKSAAPKTVKRSTDG